MLSRVLLKERTAKKAWPAYGPEQTFPFSPPLFSISTLLGSSIDAPGWGENADQRCLDTDNDLTLNALIAGEQIVRWGVPRTLP